MNKIKHQFLSVHNYALIALPTKHVPKETIFQLEQRDGSLITVERSPKAVWSFDPANMADEFTLHIFGMEAKHVLTRLRQIYPDFAALPEANQTFHFIGVKKI